MKRNFWIKGYVFIVWKWNFIYKNKVFMRVCIYIIISVFLYYNGFIVKGFYNKLDW